MDEPIEALKTALRVLTALTERTTPDRADLQALPAYAPELCDLPPDELACEVIQQALREHVLVRAAQ